MMTGSETGDWPEDFPYENGQYYCRCVHCKIQFIGHKRRVVCKNCATKDVETKKKRNRERVMDVLQEECAEVIQAVSKIRRFGLDEKWQGITNKQALITEIGDVFAIVNILLDETDINISEADIKSAIEAKMKKLEIFLPYE